MTDLNKVKGWVEEYVRLKRIEAKQIEEAHGVGWVSDNKFACADEAEEWLKSNPTELDNPISVKCCSVPDNWSTSDLCDRGQYMEYKFADGTIKRIMDAPPPVVKSLTEMDIYKMTHPNCKYCKY